MKKNINYRKRTFLFFAIWIAECIVGNAVTMWMNFQMGFSRIMHAHFIIVILLLLLLFNVFIFWGMNQNAKKAEIKKMAIFSRVLLVIYSIESALAFVMAIIFFLTK